MRFNWLLSGAIGLLGALSWLAPADAARLQSLSYTVRNHQLAITTDSAVQPRAQVIFDPVRLVIDLPGVTLGRSSLDQAVGGGIRVVRVGQFDAQTTRVVVELEPGYTLDASQVAIRSRTGADWSIQLPNPQRTNSVASTPRTRAHGFRLLFADTTTASSGSPSTPGSVQPPIEPTPSSGNPGLPPTHLNRRWVVVVDPGHGGPDPGAVGIGGLRETDLTLDVSRRIVELLQQQGVETIITRTGEQDVDLDPRVRIAERAHADLFVSIHINSLSMDRPDVNGTESYYYSDSGLQLAQVLQHSMTQVPQVQDRGIHHANFYVIKYTSMPATLLELGFITGSSDAALLGNSNFRGQMATAIASGILQYMQQHQ